MTQSNLLITLYQLAYMDNIDEEEDENEDENQGYVSIRDLERQGVFGFNDDGEGDGMYEEWFEA